MRFGANVPSKRSRVTCCIETTTIALGVYTKEDSLLYLEILICMIAACFCHHRYIISSALRLESYSSSSARP